jgi:LPXTG-motif cell wall-anchored protein
MASVVVMLPVIHVLSKSATWTWLGVFALAVLSGWLFYRRRQLRTSFFLPLIYAPGLAATHFGLRGGIDAPEFTGTIVLFIFVCVAAALTDAFWSPYQDDLDDLNYVSPSKE